MNLNFLEKVSKYQKMFSSEQEDFITFNKTLRKKIEEINEQKFKNSISVKELFWQVDFNDCFDILLSKGEVLENEKDLFKEVYSNIITQKNSSPKGYLDLTAYSNDYVVNFFDFCSYENFAVTFVPYNMISNASVNPELFDKLKKEEIVSHFLFEFSWYPTDISKDQKSKMLEEQFEGEDNFFVLEDGEIVEENPFINKTSSSKVISLDAEFKTDKNKKTTSFQDIFGSPSNSYDKSIRELFEDCNYKELKDEFYKVISEKIEFDLKVTFEEAMGIFEKNYFNLVRAVKIAPKNANLRYIAFDFNEDLFYTFKNKDTQGFGEINCAYTGKQLIDVIDFKTNEYFLNKSQVLSYFIFCYLSDELIDSNIRFSYNAEEKEKIRFNLKKNDVFKKILNVKDIHVLNVLEVEELKVLSLVTEQYLTFNYEDFEHYLEEEEEEEVDSDESLLDSNIEDNGE